MNLMIKINKLNNEDVITTSGMTVTPYCIHYGEAGYTCESYYYYHDTVTGNNSLANEGGLNAAPAYLQPDGDDIVFDLEGNQIAGLTLGKWYHIDDNGYYHECDDQAHRVTNPL